MKKNTKVFFGILIVLGVLIAAFLSNIGIDVRYYSFWFLLSLVLIGINIFFFFEKTYFKKVISVPVSILILSFLYLLYSSPVFFAKKYATLVVAEDANMSEFNTKESDVRRVTKEMAEQIGNKVTAATHDGDQISSQYEINMEKASVQNIKDKLYWVLPLDYSGFFKWLSLDSIPGYVKVSATNPREKPELVLNAEMKLSSNGYFMDNIERRVWLFSNMKKTRTHLELDDNGKPYYISAVLMPEIGFSAYGVERMIVTDPQTGEMKNVPLDKFSEKYPWVDRVWPEDLIEDRISYYGSLQDGFFNSFTTGKNVSSPTSYNGKGVWGIKIDGAIWLITGMSSINNKDRSLISLIAAKQNSTGKKPVIHVFDAHGMMDESGAVDAVESYLQINRMNGIPRLPQPYIVDNEFYWTLSIVSNKNIFQKKAYVKGDSMSSVSLDTFKAYNPEAGGSLEVDDKEAISLKIMKLISELNDLKQQYEAM